MKSIHRLLFLCWLAIVPAASAADDPPVPRVGNPHGAMALDCRLCHSEDSWELTADGGFDHDTTGFPLEGLHRHVRCRDCHLEPVFSHVGTQCADCHDDLHRGRLGPVCSDCHSPQGWIDPAQMSRDHAATALPLVGAHARVDCDACHRGAANGDFVGTPTACYACHAADYEATEEPDHLAAGFTTDCERCHGVFASTWGSGDFIHAPGFPLTGGHRLISCTECHDTGFEGTPTQCSSCHQPQYDATTNPDHAQADFPTECALCHNTSAWVPGDFDHGATAFPLTGAHRTADCFSCHETGYSGTPSECVACHQTEYDRTSDPDHAAANFPTRCDECHSTSAWDPANWDHDATYFPIYTGRHREEWNNCADCHVVQTDYSIFECIFCHEHNRDDTDRKHPREEVPDYEYSSTACYRCHPDGRAE